MIRSALALLLVLAAAPARADEPTWSSEQARVSAQIGSAIAGANLCFYLVDRTALTSAIRIWIAPSGRMTPEMAASLVNAVAEAQTMQPVILGPRPTKARTEEACRKYLATFGPNGSELPGLLKP